MEFLDEQHEDKHFHAVFVIRDRFLLLYIFIVEKHAQENKK